MQLTFVLSSRKSDLVGSW